MSPSKYHVAASSIVKKNAIYQRTPLLSSYVASRGQSASARYLIEKARMDVNKEVIIRRLLDSFLAESAHRGDLEMVKLLVGAGADLKCRDFDSIVEPPLYIAAVNNHDVVAQYLIEKGICSIQVSGPS